MPERPTARGDLRVLLVEDNPIDVKATLRAADEAGIRAQIDVAGDGEAALRNLRLDAPAGRRPDLILLDLDLPGKHGLQVLQEVKAVDALRTIPVVVLTSSAEEAEIVGAYQLGASAYVVKPVGLRAWSEVAASIAGFWLDVVRYAPAPS